MAPHNVLLVEDDASTRAHLEAAVSAHSELVLVASAGSVGEARERLAAGGVDVLLTDLGLPDGSGVELIRQAVQMGSVLSLAITVFGDEEHVVEAIRAGAMGYLLKDQVESDVGRAILEMIAGRSPISPVIARGTSSGADVMLSFDHFGSTGQIEDMPAAGSPAEARP
jgi:DNA-binding NarL/FixJ family response regulator